MDSYLSRTFSIAAVLAVLLVYVGCDTNDNTAEIINCGDLSGTYDATALTAESVADSGLLNDFEDTEWTLIFTGDRFTSHFLVANDTSVAVEGTYTVTGGDETAPGELILGTEALIPNVRPDTPQRFNCRLEDDGFELTTLDLDYDFDEDGTYEEAQFEARFDQVDPAL